jgi:hypothetical protein
MTLDSESRQRVQSRALFAERQAAVTSSPVPNLDGVAGLTGVVVVLHVLRRNRTERSNLGHPRLRFGTRRKSFVNLMRSHLAAGELSPLWTYARSTRHVEFVTRSGRENRRRIDRRYARAE